MFHLSNRKTLFILTLLLSAIAFTANQMRAQDEPVGQFFELRIYTAAPGKMDALNKRFREHTLRLFEKHGIKSIGYWTAVDEQHQGKLYYVIAYPDRASREKMLMNGIAKDPEFQKVVAESEVDGKLTEGIESVLMLATDYSPIK
jgi:hypothetical protein